MMFRRPFLDLVFVPPSDQLRLYVDFYLATFALLLTGAVAIHAPLYAYRMHGRNKHSNATVPGGTYNSSMREWEPIRNDTLKVIQAVLQRDAATLRLTFGDQRYALADAAVAAVIGDPSKPEPVPVPRGWLARALDRGSGSGS
jgi:hypothetical protein